MEPTTRGPAFSPQHGLRDPFVLDLPVGRWGDDAGRWLFCAAAGEFALGVTWLRPVPGDPTP